MHEKSLYKKNMKKDLYNIEIDIDEDIKRDIEDFYFSKNDLDNIKIPLDLEDLIEEPFEEEKQEKKTYYFNWFIDLLLVSLLLLPIVGIYNPNIFVKFENVYPFFLKTHNFLEKDNLRKILGGESESVDLKNAKPAVVVKESEVKKPKTNAEELKLIHSLANSLIKAEYKWECTEVTPKTIKKVISGIDCLRDREERIQCFLHSIRKIFCNHHWSIYNSQTKQ